MLLLYRYLVERARDARLEKTTFLSWQRCLPGHGVFMKGCVKEKTALFLVLIFQLAALGGAQSSCAALCHARRRAGCAQPGALAQAAGHQEAILRVRCSPRTALGSADSDPAKFESKMLKPYGAWEAGKRSLFLQSQTPWLETATEGCAWPHPSCRRLPHQAKHRRVCTVSRG